MIKLSKRLEVISSLIPNNASVIDIGCDHGLLDIYLCQNNISNKIIASDINKSALNNAKENIKKYNLENKIETRLGSGLDVITDKDNINAIVISGMGTNTIIDILKNNTKKLKNINNIIIQSNTKILLLRKTIIKLGYYIQDEEIVESDKKIYIIIKFTKGKKRYTKKELYFGPILLKKNSSLFKSFNQNELNKKYLILKKIPKNHFLEIYKLKKEIKLYK